MSRAPVPELKTTQQYGRAVEGNTDTTTAKHLSPAIQGSLVQVFKERSVVTGFGSLKGSLFPPQRVKKYVWKASACRTAELCRSVLTENTSLTFSNGFSEEI